MLAFRWPQTFELCISLVKHRQFLSVTRLCYVEAAQIGQRNSWCVYFARETSLWRLVWIGRICQIFGVVDRRYLNVPGKTPIGAAFGCDGCVQCSIVSL